MTDITSTEWWERFRTGASNDEGSHVELYLRSPAPVHGAHEDYLEMHDRLERAVGAGTIDSYETTILGEEICLCERCQRTHLGRTFTETCFALRDGGARSVEPLGFEERRIESEYTGDDRTVLVLPTVCVGVYAADSLQGVFPSRIDGHRIDVQDFLEALSRGRAEPNRPRVDA